MLYVDSSAFTRRYIEDETGHADCVQRMNAHLSEWATSRLSTIEVPRGLHRTLTPDEARARITDFDADLRVTVLIDLDVITLGMAREIALTSHVKTLDAIHIASALRVGNAPDEVTFLTYDIQQRRAAQRVGLQVT